MHPQRFNPQLQAAPVWFELANDGLLVVHDRVILDLNPSLAEICGYAFDELAGKPLDAIVDGDEPALSEAIASLIAGEANRPPSVRARLLHKGGHPVPVRIRAGVIHHREPNAVLLVVENLSAELKADQELRNRRQLESMAALSGGIAHDYNNLLTVIIGNTSLIRSIVGSVDSISPLLSEILEASMVAKSLTQKLITFSKGGAPRKAAADILPVLKTATEFSLSGSNVRVRFRGDPDLAQVDIDKAQIGQAIHNLVMNAREAMPAGGVLTITARNRWIEDRRSGLQPGAYVGIDIEDEGCGIAAAHLDHVFDPYFSTKARGREKGMGLGLSICQSIIQKHSGLIKIDSSDGRGTRVEILLPAAPASAARIRPPEAAAVPEASFQGRGRILLMDDEERIVKLSSLMLQRLGYEVEFAESGEEAIERFRSAMQCGAPFDGVILDLTVRGGMGGSETIRHLQKIDPAVKALVSSGYSNSPVMTDPARYGFCDVIVKPYDLETLGESLYRLLHPKS